MDLLEYLAVGLFYLPFLAIPFIMLSNALLVVIFNSLHKRTLPGAVITAAIGKFLFLWSLTFLLANFFTQGIGLKALGIGNCPGSDVVG